MLYAPDIRNKHGSFGYKEAVQLVISSSAVRHAERDDVEPAEGLFDDCVQIDELARVREVWQAVWTDDRVELHLDLTQHIREKAQSQ